MNSDINDSSASDCDLASWNGNAHPATSISTTSGLTTVEIAYRPVSEQAAAKIRADRGRAIAERDENYQAYRRICGQLQSEVERLGEFVHEGEVTDEGLEVIVEIEHLFELLYDCSWGEPEALKRAVVAVQAQIGNVVWTTRHVGFVRDVVRLLSVRYLINSAVVDDCHELVASHGLEKFRGTIWAPETRKIYRLQEVTQQDAEE